MASKILVDELAPYSHATDVTLATGKKISGAETQFKITGGSNTNMLTTDGAGALSWSAQPVQGLAEFDQWYLTSGFSGSVNPIVSNFSRLNLTSYGRMGTGMTLNSGTWSFPSTGKWFISWHIQMQNSITTDSTSYATLKVSTNTGGSYTIVANDASDTAATGSTSSTTMTSTYFMDVTNLTTHLVQVGATLEHSGNVIFGGSITGTNVTFMKVGS